MSHDVFMAWFDGQSGAVKEAVMFGPPFLVFMAIGLTLGGEYKFLRSAWGAGPAMAAGLDSICGDAEADDEPEWKENADAALDQAIARHRGVPVRPLDAPDT